LDRTAERSPKQNATLGREERIRERRRDRDRILPLETAPTASRSTEGAKEVVSSLEVAVANFLINLEAKGYIRINRELVTAGEIQK
jgi:hypothetical protein